MYIKDGITYAGEAKRPITIISIRALDDYKLWSRLSTGEVNTLDFGIIPLRMVVLSIYIGGSKPPPYTMADSTEIAVCRAEVLPLCRA